MYELALHIVHHVAQIYITVGMLSFFILSSLIKNSIFPIPEVDNIFFVLKIPNEKLKTIKSNMIDRFLKNSLLNK